jgi:importin-5
VYGYLCDLIQANHPIILGNNNTNLPRIVSIIAESFHREVVPITNPEAVRMLGIVKQIESNPEVFQACINHLSAEQKHGLEEAYRALAAA